MLGNREGPAAWGLREFYPEELVHINRQQWRKFLCFQQGETKSNHSERCQSVLFLTRSALKRNFSYFKSCFIKWDPKLVGDCGVDFLKSVLANPGKGENATPAHSGHQSVWAGGEPWDKAHGRLLVQNHMFTKGLGWTTRQPAFTLHTLPSQGGDVQNTALVPISSVHAMKKHNMQQVETHKKHILKGQNKHQLMKYHQNYWMWNLKHLWF